MKAHSILKLSLVSAVLLVSTVALSKGKPCKWSDEAKLRSHLETHVTYPITGKALKEVCKKEMPDEFTKAEKKCLNRNIANKKKYEDANQAFTDLTAKKTK